MEDEHAAGSAVVYLMVSRSTFAAEPETCFSRQHQNAIINVRQALNTPATVMDARVVRSERDCVLACCSEELKPGAKCNMAVFNGLKRTGDDNCFLFHCQTEQDCPLAKAQDGINTYDIYKGVIHPTTVRPVTTAAAEASTTPATATTTHSASASPPDGTTPPPPTSTTTPAASRTSIAVTKKPNKTTRKQSKTEKPKKPRVYPASTSTSLPVGGEAERRATDKTQPRNQTVSPTTTPPPTSTTTTTTTATTSTTTTKSTTTTTTTTVSPTTTPTTPPPSTTTTTTTPPPSTTTTTTTPPPSTAITTTTPPPSTTTTTTTPPTTSATTPPPSTATTATTPPPSTTAPPPPPTITTTTTSEPSTTNTTPAASLIVVPKDAFRSNHTVQNVTPGRGRSSGAQGAVKSGVVAFMVLGLAVLTLALAVGGRKAMESFDRRHYTRLELNDLHYEV